MVQKVSKCSLHPRYVEAAIEYRHQTINEVPYKKVKKRQNFYALRKDRDLTKFKYLTQLFLSIQKFQFTKVFQRSQEKV